MRHFMQKGHQVTMAKIAKFICMAAMHKYMLRRDIKGRYTRARIKNAFIGRWPNCPLKAVF